MPALTHSPARIIRQLLIDQGLATAPESSLAWPAYCPTLPSDPDDAITVQGGSGLVEGRFSRGGQLLLHYGIQVLIRSRLYDDGYTKAEQIAVWMDETVYNDSVTIEGHVYSVNTITRTTDVFEMGFEVPYTKRQMFSIPNALVSICIIS